MTRHRELLESAAAGEHFAILHDAERVIADPIVRNRGTVGGSICQADPSEDLSAVFAALRAERGHPFVVGRAGGRRWTTSTRVPTAPRSARPRCSSRCGCRSGPGPAAPTRRSSAAWATGRSWPRARTGRCSTATASPTPASAWPPSAPSTSGRRRPRRRCAGRPPATRRFARGRRARRRRAATRSADQRGPDDYKRHLAEELTVRALRRAAARARGEEG